MCFTFDQVPYSITLSAFLGSGDNRPLRFEQLPFGQPLFILYSSGTSGKPKCIVHSAGVCFFSIYVGPLNLTQLWMAGCVTPNLERSQARKQYGAGRYIFAVHNSRCQRTLFSRPSTNDTTDRLDDVDIDALRAGMRIASGTLRRLTVPSHRRSLFAIY